jgi:hypothetical protein
MLLKISLSLLAALSPIFASALTIDTQESKILSTFEKRFAEARSVQTLGKRDASDVAATCNLGGIVMPTGKFIFSISRLYFLSSLPNFILPEISPN